MYGRKDSFSICFCSTVLWLPPLQMKAVFSWCWQVRLLIKKHDRGGWKKFTPFTVSNWISTFRGWCGRETLAHKTVECIKPGIFHSSGQEVLEMKSKMRVCCCTPWEEQSWALPPAQPKPLRGQLEVLRTEIQHNQRGSFIHSLGQQNAS